MAGKFTVHQLVTKMLGDVTFRAAVIKDPAKALKAIKVKPTAAQVAALKAIDWNSLDRVYSSFSTGVHPDTFT